MPAEVDRCTINGEQLIPQPACQHDVAAAAPRDAVRNVGHFLAQPNDDMSGDEVAHDAGVAVAL
jgi:hypothetical protein